MIKRLSRLKISALFSLSIFLFGSIFVFLQTLVVLTSNMNFLEERITENGIQVSQQIGLRIDDAISSIVETSVNIRLSDYVSALSEIDKNNSYSQLALLYDANNTFSAMAHSDNNILGIYLLTDRLSLYNERTINGIFDITRIYDTELYNYIEDKNSGFVPTQDDYFSQVVFEANPVNAFYYFYNIKDSQDNPLATLLILIDEAIFAKTYLTQTPEAGQTFLFTSTGELISPYTSLENNEQRTELYEEISSGIAKSNNESYFEVEFANDIYIGTQYNLQNDWELVHLYPRSYIGDGIDELRNLSILIGVISLIIALAVAIIFTVALRRPINHLISDINLLGADNLDVEFDVTLRNEIGDINRQLSKIMQRLKRNVEEIKDNKDKLRQSECKALQSQINPHFLYNTLDAINWMAIKSGASEISEMSMNLGTFFRHTHNKDKMTTTIESELLHLGAYMSIQDYRYNSRFTFNTEVDPKTLQCTIVNIVLQPLVENALLHGAAHTNGECKIDIKIFTENTEVIIDVLDDGCGFDIEKTNKNLEKEISVTSGYGIINVHQRLRLHFGQMYGLSYLPKDKGTHARIRIPFNT